MDRGKNIHALCCEDNYFPKRKFKLFNGLFHSLYLVFSIRLISIADLFAVCYLWNVSNEDKCCVETHRAADIIVGSLGLLTWLVYVRTYCVSIATLNQNKRSRLPYLGDAQKTSDTNLRPVNHRFPSVRVSSLTVE